MVLASEGGHLTTKALTPLHVLAESPTYATDLTTYFLSAQSSPIALSCAATMEATKIFTANLIGNQLATEFHGEQTNSPELQYSKLAIDESNENLRINYARL